MSSFAPPSLPITDLLPQITAALQTHWSCIIEAAPGSGKTTVVPLHLLDQEWCIGKKILVLEPRKIAAKGAATRMASMLQEEIAQTVGYRMRNDTRVSGSTRIEVITEGVLPRLLQSNPELDGIGAIVFDEFHERSITVDLGLALTLWCNRQLNNAVKIIVMSATLSAKHQLQELLGNAPVISNTERKFSIDMHWQAPSQHHSLEEHVARTAIAAALEHKHDVLCFLPGVAEVHKTQEHIWQLVQQEEHTLRVVCLHGNSPQAEVSKALGRDSTPRSERQIVVSTAIAESSITIPGIGVVVDAGRSREPRFDSRAGFTKLTTVDCSVESAEQRAGRAGRTMNGHCYRLWTQEQHRVRPLQRQPEILSADLAPIMLDLAVFGIQIQNAPWLTTPTVAAIEQARSLLQSVSAIDEQGKITPHGVQMHELGTHPRIAHMILTGAELGVNLTVLCTVAAMLEERDILRTTNDADITHRLSVALGAKDAHANTAVVTQVQQQTQQLLARTKHLPVQPNQYSPAATLAYALALAFPDRVAQRKSAGKYILQNGRTVKLAANDPLAKHEWLCIAWLHGMGNELTIGLAAPSSKQELLTLWQHPTTGTNLHTTSEPVWHEQTAEIKVQERTTNGALQLETKQVLHADEHVLALMLAEKILERGLEILEFSEESLRTYHRVLFAQHHQLLPQENLITAEILASYLLGKRRLKDAGTIPTNKLLASCIPTEYLNKIIRSVPEYYQTKSNKKVPIDYSDPERPIVRVRLQEVFGVKKTPRIGDNNIPLTIELLSPANRPIQITQDLESFWSGSYAMVRKEMKGRYPKHNWPEA